MGQNNIIKPESNIWFSSDFHLGHSNIAGPKTSSWRDGYRDFDSVQEMNQEILKNINKYVKWDDTLYFLGDFCFGGHKNTPGYRDQINCQTIHVVRGNHDGKIDSYKDKFTSIQDVLTLDIDGKGNPKRTIFMSHYAHRVWLGSHKGVIHLYAHSHNSIPDHGKSMDVGIDVAKWLTGEYKPFSLEEILKIMEGKETAFVDHHDKDTNMK